MLFVPPQHGKLISHDTPVLTAVGWKTHGDLMPGDYVFGRKGQPVRVTAVSEEDQADQLVSFTDGSQIQCHARHEWVVFDRSSHGSPQCRLETGAMKEQGVWLGVRGRRGGRGRFQLDANVPIDFPEQDLDLHPYILGVWLGNGAESKNCIVHSSADSALVERVEALGIRRTTTTVHAMTGVYTSYFHALYGLLKQNDLLGHKHIPEKYLIASRSQRLELLAGLIDADGYLYHKNGRVTYSSCSEEIIEGVRKLVVSLGWRVSIAAADPVVSSSGIHGRQVVYQLCFNPTQELPVTLVRKQVIGKDPMIRRRSITAIQTVAPKLGRCIQVEGGIYLVGKTLIPTHNSEISTRSFPAWVLGQAPDTKIAICSYSATLASSFNRDIQIRMDDSRYQALFPNTRLNSRNLITVAVGGVPRNSEVFGVVGHEGFVKTVGVGGSLTGTPVDLGIIDDPVKDRDTAMSLTIRNKTWAWYTDVFETRLHNDSAQVMILTRWHEDDNAGRALARDGIYSESNPDGWVVISFPALRTEDVNDFDPRSLGEALWPERHSQAKIEKVKRDNAVTFNSMYQQDPKPSKDVLVFPDWIEVPEFPRYLEDKAFYAGDFGFTNHPTACVKIAVEGPNIYCDELFYERGLTNPDILHRYQALSLSTQKESYWDGAEPKSITELRRGSFLNVGGNAVRLPGINAINQYKPQGSIVAGISKLKEYRVHYTARSRNLKQEINNYQWIMNGAVSTNEPVDDFNHAIDAIRAGVFTKYGSQRRSTSGFDNS